MSAIEVMVRPHCVGIANMDVCISDFPFERTGLGSKAGDFGMTVLDFQACEGRGYCSTCLT